MKGQLRIDQVFAFIARDHDGTEGVCGFLGVDGVPLIGADLAMVEKLRPVARLIAKANQTPITLAYFSNRTNIETIPVNPSDDKEQAQQ